MNDVYQSQVPNIYGAGDVIGFPSLASTSREQGRIATCHAFGVEAKHAPELFPYGIYTIPEISFVGKNEEELTDKGVPYEVGKAQYREIARGQIVGDTTSGMLKLLFERNTRELLGVHVIGEGAVNWCTSARRCFRSTVRWTTSSKRFSTIRRWPNATAMRPSTASTIACQM